MATATTPRLAEGLAQRRIPSLDGLRAVAVLLVIFNHLNVPYFPEGRGVLTFFVLSGFLITWILLNESGRSGGISIRNFYVRRVLRIFPAFYIFWGLQVVGFLLIHGRMWPSAIADYLSAFFYVSNYRTAMSYQSHQFIGHTWALSLEEQFYLLWPWLFVAFRKDLRKFTWVLVALIAAVDIYRFVLFFGFHVRDRWLTYSFDSRVDHLLVGCLLAVLLKRGHLTRFWTFISNRWVSLMTLALIIASIVTSRHYDVGYKYAAGFIVDPLLTALLIVQVIALGGTWPWAWLNWRITRHVGQVSYSMFLYHGITNYVAIHLVGQKSKLAVVPIAVLLAVGAGTISYYLVELKFLRLKERFIGKPAAAPQQLTPWKYEMAPARSE
jgi:peptidoglycan/LPS O-acetylase OafA/YrhL